MFKRVNRLFIVFVSFRKLKKNEPTMFLLEKKTNHIYVFITFTQRINIYILCMKIFIVLKQTYICLVVFLTLKIKNLLHTSYF